MLRFNKMSFLLCGYHFMLRFNKMSFYFADTIEREDKGVKGGPKTR
jgi:hypothetical protein